MNPTYSDSSQSTRHPDAERRSGADRRSAEEERASDRQRQLYRLLIERVTDYAIFVLDPTGHIATWNSGARRLKGYTDSEIIGRHFSIFYPEQDVRDGKPDRELETATKEGRVEDEGWRVRKDGTRFWANVVITALRDEEGTLVGFAKITRDLTERRVVEEQARRLAGEEAARSAAEHENAELATMASQLQQQAIELEAQTEEAQALSEELEESNESLRVALGEAERAQEASRFLAAASKALSASLDYEVTLRELAHVFVPEFADWCTVDVVGEDDGITRQVALAHVNPDKVRWAQELAKKYPPDPQATTGVPSVVRTRKPELYHEITDAMVEAAATNAEHLRLIRELHLRSAIIVPLIGHDRTLGALTLVASDDGRRYVEADLELAMEVARRAALAIDNARAHRAEQRARAEAESANAAKMQFLAVMSHELRTPLNAIAGYADLLKMGLRGPVTSAQADDLDRIVHSEQTLLSIVNDVLNYAKLESGHAEFHVGDVGVTSILADVEALVMPQLRAKEHTFESHVCAASVRVRADPEKVRQIVVNLLSNAIKFTPPGGAVRVECATADHLVCISVRDTGVGIPAEKLEAVFEPFVQVDAKLTRAHQGTGLGLAIGRDLARAMGGNLTVKSEAGKGSTFTLTLPRVPDGSAPEDATATPSSHR